MKWLASAMVGVSILVAACADQAAAPTATSAPTESVTATATPDEATTVMPTETPSGAGNVASGGDDYGAAYGDGTTEEKSDDAMTQDEEMPEEGAMEEATPTPVTMVEEVQLSIGDFFFSPRTESVPMGTKVLWVNDGSAPHTTTDTVSGDSAGARGQVWDSGVLSTGDVYSRTFTEPGTYTYICAIHPSMRATITVE